MMLSDAANAATSFSLSPSSEIDFTAQTGATATKTITIQNNTAYSLALTLAYSGSGAALFTTSSSYMTIGAYMSQSATITFSPIVAGLDTAKLNVVSSALDSASVLLMGHAISAGGMLQITPAGLLTLVSHVSSSTADTLNISNRSASATTVSLALSGSGAALFSVNPNSLTIAGDGSSSTVVSFSPLVSGYDSATLTAISSSGDTQRISLVGHSLARVSFLLTPAGSLVFNTKVDVPDTQMLTIANQTANLLSLALVPSGSSAFSVNLTNVTVLANGSTTVPIIFKSSTAGTANGSLLVRSLTGDTATVSLIGHAMLSVEGSLRVADEIEFETKAGQTECLPVSIKNNTTGAVTISNLTITGDSNDFRLTGSGSLQVAADSSASVTVCYTPTTASGEQHATLTFQFAGVTDTTLKGTERVELNGSVEGRLDLGDSIFFLTTQNIEFNNVLVGTTDCQAVRISNPTASVVTIDSAAITGSSASSFTVSGASMLQVAAHSTAFVNVCFSPTVAMENQSATLELFATGTTGPSRITISIDANAIDSLHNNGELTNCIFVRHESGVIGPILRGGTDTSAIFLTNRTNGSVTINGASISGSGSSAFSVSSSLPITIQSGGTAQLMVAFNPTTGTDRSSFGADITLNATGSAMTCGPITVHVEGVAVPGMLGNRDTSDIDLGAGLTGNGTKVIGIVNNTGNACVIDTIMLVNTTSASIVVNQVILGQSTNFTLMNASSFPVTITPGSSLPAMVQVCNDPPSGATATDPMFVATNQSIQPQTFQLQSVAAAAAGVIETIDPATINLAIMPNPTSDRVAIQLDQARSANVEIFDMLGNVLETLHGNTSFNWDTRDAAGTSLPNGAYIVRVTGVDLAGQPFRTSKQLVIER
ncbi:MAG: choice-of-anchor D domain-containing protein [Bacteroidota bacterium]|nr:choice-of-anchor D domain-containing protein [Bacteroidota bacterium]MDP4234180.1 choice-of-anchor D domain-containing protein [Bacteroidota bacterium]MDP4243754.1 choice-of-anchor D domain-containing protein [Bacteroidota bacterium]MDP4287881.1 choice-of-anchor D domain-containing protein [Bacteroidota bacterium]